MSEEINQIIEVKQLPIIVEQLQTIKANVTSQVESALNLECTEDTYKEVKKVRSDLNKQFKDFESRRTEVKKKILEPYEKFDTVYKDCVINVFKPADNELKRKIDEVEDKLKKVKIDFAVDFFNEHCKNFKIDFLTFADVGLTININTSKKSISDNIKAFVDKISDDVKMIQTQDNSSEIFVEFKKSLNVSQAIMLVNERHKAIEEEKKRVEELKALEEQKAQAEQKVDEVIEEEEIMQAPVVAEVPVQTEEVTEDKPVEKIYKMSFAITGTINQLKEIKKFLVDGGYKYEQL